MPLQSSPVSKLARLSRRALLSVCAMRKWQTPLLWVCHTTAEQVQHTILAAQRIVIACVQVAHVYCLLCVSDQNVHLADCTGAAGSVAHGKAPALHCCQLPSHDEASRDPCATMTPAQLSIDGIAHCTPVTVPPAVTPLQAARPDDWQVRREDKQWRARSLAGIGQPSGVHSELTCASESTQEIQSTILSRMATCSALAACQGATAASSPMHPLATAYKRQRHNPQQPR